MSPDASEILRYFTLWRKETDSQLKAVIITISKLRTDLQYVRNREAALRSDNKRLRKELKTLHNILEKEVEDNFGKEVLKNKIKQDE